MWTLCACGVTKVVHLIVELSECECVGALIASDFISVRLRRGYTRRQVTLVSGLHSSEGYSRRRHTLVGGFQLSAGYTYRRVAVVGELHQGHRQYRPE